MTSARVGLFTAAEEMKTYDLASRKMRFSENVRIGRAVTSFILFFTTRFVSCAAISVVSPRYSSAMSAMPTSKPVLYCKPARDGVHVGDCPFTYDLRADPLPSLFEHLHTGTTRDSALVTVSCQQRAGPPSQARMAMELSGQEYDIRPTSKADKCVLDDLVTLIVHTSQAAVAGMNA